MREGFSLNSAPGAQMRGAGLPLVDVRKEIYYNTA